MTYTHEIVDTATGEPLASIVDPSESGWGRALGMPAGQKKTVFQLGDRSAPKRNWLDLTEDWERGIVTSWKGVPIYWGLFTGARYKRRTKEWTVRHVDWESIWSRRYTLGTNGYSGDTTDNILDLTNRSLKSMIPWILWSGTVGATPNYFLPVRLESGLPLNSTAGNQTGPHTRKFNDWNFTTIRAGLDEVQSMPDGPDVDHQPMRDPVTGWYYINVRVGSPLLTAKRHAFNLDAATPGLVDVEYDSDGMKRRNATFAIGTGSEMLMAVKTARAPGARVALEMAEEYKGKDDGDDALQAHANADLATYSKATKQWAGTMLTAGTFDDEKRQIAKGVEAYRMGDTFECESWGDPVMPDGKTDNILVALDGDASKNTFTPTFQPIGGV
jgi:hypothetical protein